MCRVFLLQVLCIIYVYLKYADCHALGERSVAKNAHKNNVAHRVASALKSKSANSKKREYEEDEEDEGEDEVDTELDKVEEREEEEEQMLEDAEDIGVKESVEEEESEADFAKERTKVDAKGKEDPRKEGLRYLMDKLISLSTQLKQINSEINSLTA